MSTNTTTDTDESPVRAHPWHGVNPTAGLHGLQVYIENIPGSPVKYEVDEVSGILKVDHPIDTSSLPPAAYGFVPRTLCGPRVAQLNSRLRGDRAALDVFVLSERALIVPDVLAEVRIVGGVPVRDETFVDDKLIAVLLRDAAFGHMQQISDVPVYLLDRICHFLASVSPTGSAEVGDPFDAERAQVLLQAGLQDYAAKFPGR